ncbi:hypothetical protein ACMG4P_24725 [Pseudovibrio denitrificans]|uniref:hypothetical protein n=1 Tax=Pseudovibrio denitrificans TaxID=258256 RepID=UPI0039BEE659
MKRYPSVSHWIVNLTYITIGVTVNLTTLPGSKFVYARECCEKEVERQDYRVYLHHSDCAEDSELNWLENNSLNNFRGKRFRSGFYVSHHFDNPAYLFDIGGEIHVVGSTLDKLLWSYFTKYFLTIEAELRGRLHLKAAVIDIDGSGVALVGRGSAGKTVFTTEACKRGATFVCNTHAIVRGDGYTIGVQSPMRVRKDEYFSPLISKLKAQPHINDTEYTLHPDQLFLNNTTKANIKNIIILDYNPDAQSNYVEISKKQMYDFCYMFSLPIPTYGIKDDILYWKNNDHHKMFEVISNMNQTLREFIDNTRCYYVNTDIRQDENYGAIMRMLDLNSHSQFEV